MDLELEAHIHVDPLPSLLIRLTVEINGFLFVGCFGFCAKLIGLFEFVNLVGEIIDDHLLV